MSVVYFHGSFQPLAIGLTLQKMEGSYVDQPDSKVLEELFESYRPITRLSRLNSVFLCSSVDDIDLAGGYTDYVYEVAPHGLVEKSDLAWYSEAEISLCNGDHDRAASCAKNYWAGMPFDRPENSLFEFRCKSADVSKEVLPDFSFEPNF